MHSFVTGIHTYRRILVLNRFKKPNFDTYALISKYLKVFVRMLLYCMLILYEVLFYFDLGFNLLRLCSCWYKCFTIIEEYRDACIIARCDTTTRLLKHAANFVFCKCFVKTRKWCCFVFFLVSEALTLTYA